MSGKSLHAQPGYRYGLLTVIEDLGYAKRDRRVLVECRCGRQKEVSVSNLRRGRSRSCGYKPCRFDRNDQYIESALDDIAQVILDGAGVELERDEVLS